MVGLHADTGRLLEDSESAFQDYAIAHDALTNFWYIACKVEDNLRADLDATYGLEWVAIDQLSSIKTLSEHEKLLVQRCATR